MEIKYCCDRFANCVTEGEIVHADDNDETEWYVPNKMTEHETNKMNKTEDTKSSRNYGGILWGLVLGVFVVGAYVLELSPSEFRNTSKLGLSFGILVFVALGAVFGEKFMEKLGEWLKWF